MLHNLIQRVHLTLWINYFFDRTKSDDTVKGKRPFTGFIPIRHKPYIMLNFKTDAVITGNII